MSSIANKLERVREQINTYASKSDRSPEEVTLLAVSKTKPAEDIRTAFNLGQKDFGENYLQESVDKIEALHDLDITWHFIGPLQSNKTRLVAENFDWVHTVDRLKIAQRLSDQRPDSLPPLNICVQVNISEEESKSGCKPSEVTKLVEQISLLPNICVKGLMAIPKATEDKHQQLQAFKAMKNLLASLQQRNPLMKTLSMGMSGDMEAAISEGATIVRIGTAIFGARPPKQEP